MNVVNIKNKTYCWQGKAGKEMEEIKYFRKKIDAVINTLRCHTSSSEMTLALRAAQNSKGFLGKVLGEIGSPTPYPQSENAENNVIEPQAEHTKEGINLSGNSRISTVKELRAELSGIVKDLKSHYEGDYRCDNVWGTAYFVQSVISLEESKMWLGWELDRIREIDEPKNQTMYDAAKTKRDLQAGIEQYAKLK